jgi:iron complex transport system substrate-binding protein
MATPSQLNRSLRISGRDDKGEGHYGPQQRSGDEWVAQVSLVRPGVLLASGAWPEHPGLKSETWATHQLLSLDAPLFPLSSRPKRSVVERSLCGCSYLEMFFEPLTRRAFVTSMVSLALTTRLSAQTKPARIVSTAPSITEALFALGLGPHVVGVSRFCDFPPEVQKLPKVGTYIKPDPEAIARLAPDLVILQGNPTELINRLEALHIVFVEVPHGTLNDVFAGIEIIAKAAGYPERAAPLVSRIQAGLDAIQTKAKALPSPRVMIIADRRQGTLTDLISIGPDNYVNEILQIAGGINVLAKPGQPHYPRISLETVLRENPDVLIDLSGNQESEAERQAGRSATLALWRQNAELTAVRSGRVYVGTTNALLVPGPRTVEAAQRLFDYLHGGGNQN